MHLARICLVAALALVLAGCENLPGVGSGSSESGSPAVSPAGSRIAAGLYRVGGGRAQAVGTLVWIDAEGGFWAVTGGPGTEGDSASAFAEIVDAEPFQDRLEAAKGQTVSVVGFELEKPSKRVEGPKLQIQSVDVIADTQGAAE